MMPTSLLFVIFPLFVGDSLAITIKTHDGACKANTDEGTIDLSPIANSDGKPK